MNNYPVSLGVTCGQHAESPSSCWLVDFLNKDYYYKLLAIQIYHDAGMEPISYSGPKFFSCRGTNQRLVP
jgi:hypothetical protein